MKIPGATTKIIWIDDWNELFWGITLREIRDIIESHFPNFDIFKIRKENIKRDDITFPETGSDFCNNLQCWSCFDVYIKSSNQTLRLINSLAPKRAPNLKIVK